jgi:hypothetical protein
MWHDPARSGEIVRSRFLHSQDPSGTSARRRRGPVLTGTAMGRLIPHLRTCRNCIVWVLRLTISFPIGELRLKPSEPNGHSFDGALNGGQ